MNPREGLVSCVLSQGMFDNEYAVEIDLFDGKKVSLFADSGLVTANGSEFSGYLMVNVIDVNRDVSTILLPSETFETGSRYVQVSRERVEFKENDPQQC
jgi:hypothetical protein